MSEFVLTGVEAPQAMSALQGPTTNSLVHNPFALAEVEPAQAMSALQGPTTNSLVHNPFALEA